MRKAHKIFFLLQFIAFIFIIVYQSMAVNPEILLGLFAVVFFLEIGILEQQNKYKKIYNIIRERKKIKLKLLTQTTGIVLKKCLKGTEYELVIVKRNR